MDEHRSIGALFLVTRGNSTKHDTASHYLGLSTVIRSDARLGGIDDGSSGRGRALATMLAPPTASGRNRSKGGNGGRRTVSLHRGGQLLVLLLLLLLSGVCAPGCENGGLLRSRNDGSSSCPAQCTT